MINPDNSFNSPLVLDTLYQGISSDKWQTLFELASQRGVLDKSAAMFAGEKINASENRPVLHTALRNLSNSPVIVDGQDIMPEIQRVWRQIKQCCHQFIGITDIIHIGIGGSDFGPRMVCDALWSEDVHQKAPIRVHFLSNIDSADLAKILARAQPNSTRVIIVSKTFTTLETMQNAQSVMQWLSKQGLTATQISKMIYAVTADPAQARQFGVTNDHILPFWDWVGGRFSVWSAVGLPIALRFGFETYQRLLAGAYAMDQHFRYAPVAENQPLTLALALYNNQLQYGAKAQGIIPYAQSLNLFPSWLQQLEMESNGKTNGLDQQPVPFSAVVIFGSPGTNSQHSYFQMLHQGPQFVPIDFIAVKEPMSSLPAATEHHRQLIANCLAQSQALAKGDQDANDPNLSYSGGRPNNLIWLPKLDAFHLGALMALYEHRSFCLGVLYGVNSFDQPGVELGKKLAKPIDHALSHPEKTSLLADLDPVTAKRITWFNTPSF